MHGRSSVALPFVAVVPLYRGRLPPCWSMSCSVGVLEGGPGKRRGVDWLGGAAGSSRGWGWQHLRREATEEPPCIGMMRQPLAFERVRAARCAVRRGAGSAARGQPSRRPARWRAAGRGRVGEKRALLCRPAWAVSSGRRLSRRVSAGGVEGRRGGRRGRAGTCPGGVKGVGGRAVEAAAAATGPRRTAGAASKQHGRVVFVVVTSRLPRPRPRL